MAAIVRKTWIDDDGSGTTGTPIKNSTLQGDIYDPVDASIASLGTWTAVPFNVANFWPGMTTAMVVQNRYSVINKTLLWILQISAGVAPAAATAYMPFVTPLQPISGCVSPCALANDISGGGVVASAVVFSNAASVVVQKNSGANWTAGGQIYIYFTATIALA